jgi:hypothetical protein
MARPNKTFFAMLFCMTCIVFGLPAQEATAPEQPSTNGTIGIIFNVPSILLDIEGYQTGIGVKIATGKIAFRALADLSYSNASESFKGKAGVAFEYHLSSARVSPYVGGLMTGGFLSWKSTTDEDNWTQYTAVPFTFGAIFGIELRLLPYVSLFAEYEAALEVSRTNTKVSADGVVTPDPQTPLTFDTGIGNDSKIGIVVYFK